MTTSDQLPSDQSPHDPHDQLPYDSEETMLSLDGGTLHVCQDGPRDAPAILLVHGTGASARSWEPLLPLLTDTRRVIRVDLLGCGESGVPTGPEAADGYAVDNQARLVGDALDRLGLERVVVVGHSSGGVFATAIAERRPDRVRGVVLVNTGPSMSAYIAKEVALRTAAWSDLTDDEIRVAMADGFRPGFAIPQAYVEQFRVMDFGSFGAISQAIRAYLIERPLPDRLAPLGQPLLVLFGEQDQRWSPAAAADYGKVPGATVTMLPSVGHSPNLEDPPLVAVPLVAFSS